MIRIGAILDEIDPSDPLQVIALPPLIMDMLAAQHGLPAERCADDCVILACAYAHLGIAAQVRVAELAITDSLTGTGTVEGSLEPRWQDGMFHGHTVLWLPAHGCLVDPTAGQYFEDPGMGDNGGPVILPRGPGPHADRPGPDEPLRVEGPRANLLLRYTLAPAGMTAALLAHPRMREESSRNQRRGMNVAAQALTLLAETLPAHELGRIPHPRAAALAQAVRDLPSEQDAAGNHLFVVPGPEGLAATVPLSGIPLPAGTPPIADMN